MINRIFGRLRSKTASQDRFTAPFLGRLVRLDLPKLNVKSLLAVLAVLLLIIPAAPIQAVTYSEVLSDYIDVKFELIEETPVSVTFEVTVTNTGYELEGMPLEILVDGAPVKTITLTEHKKIGYHVKEPVYGQVTKSYTSVYGLYTDAATKALETDELSESKTFIDYGKDGKTVIREGTYETFDAKTKTWYWTETEQTGEKTVRKTEIVKNNVVKEPYRKLEPVILDLPAKDDARSGYGEGTLYYTVTLDTGLLNNNDGWGSAGVMTWRIAGKDYTDLENSSWWATNWRYKRRITIDATSIADTLEEFPVAVFLNDANFNFNHCQADGDDFRFLDADDNNLAYEIDLSSDFTDNAIFYVNVPEIVGGTDDGYIDMYYGNPTCISGENIHGTWDDSLARGAGWISFTNSTLRDDVLTVGAETWADIPQGPKDLAYTIDGSDVMLNWIKGLRADTTVIVRKEGSYPMTPADGVVVYDGIGTSVIDTGASTETNELYYRAWSYNDWGYSIEYAEARKGAIMTELIMVLGLTAFALWRKEIWVYIPALFALVFIGMRWAESDLLFGIPFFTLALFMAVRLGWVTIQKARG